MSATPTLYLYRAEDDLPSFSPPCAKVALALARSGLPHVVERVRGDPMRYSPTGRLPTLVVGAEVVTDSVRILDRIEALDPPRPFWPDDAEARTRDRLWEHYANGTLYWLGLYERWLVPENRRRLLDELFGRGLLSFKRRVIAPIVSRQVRARAVGHGVGLQKPDEVRAAFSSGLAMIEEALAGGPYLNGRSEPGRGDFAVTALIAQASYRGITPWADAQVCGRPALVAHARQVFESCALPVPLGLRG